jgi:hypothetical protein
VLDWRFLLDDPRLHVVAASPDCPSQLIAALRRASGRDPVPLAEAAAADLVILVNPSRAEIRTVAASLSPGGRVCVFTGGAGQGGPLAVSRRRALVRELQRRVTGEVTVYWSRRGVLTPTAFVPLGDRACLRDALRRHGGHPVGVARAGLAELIPRSAVIVAQRREELAR